MLLFGEDRGPEGGVVHPQDGVHVTTRIAHPLGHSQTVAMGFGTDCGIGARDGAPDYVDVAFVLEGDLGDALAVGPGRRHLFFGGARLAPQRPEDRLEQRRLAGSVGPVHPDQPGGQDQVELFLEDPVVAQVYAVDQHAGSPRR